MPLPDVVETREHPPCAESVVKTLWPMNPGSVILAATLFRDVIIALPEAIHFRIHDEHRMGRLFGDLSLFLRDAMHEGQDLSDAARQIMQQTLDHHCARCGVHLHGVIVSRADSETRATLLMALDDSETAPTTLTIAI